MANKTTTTNNPPVHTVRVGSIKGAIWANETDNGTQHAVTFSRGYKTDDGWQDTSSFGARDLLVLAKIADMAFHWIHENDERFGR